MTNSVAASSVHEATDVGRPRRRHKEREPEFCAFFAGEASSRSRSPSHNPVKVTTAMESEGRRLNGNKWCPIIRSLFQLPQPPPLALFLSLSPPFFSPSRPHPELMLALLTTYLWRDDRKIRSSWGWHWPRRRPPPLPLPPRHR